MKYHLYYSDNYRNWHAYPPWRALCGAIVSSGPHSMIVSRSAWFRYWRPHCETCDVLCALNADNE